MKPYYETNYGIIYQGDVLDILRRLPDESVHCCVTSPPYWGLRDYGVDGQLGLEKTPEEYVSKMVEIFGEVKRVLRDDGTLWLNMGDSYWAGKGQSGQGSPEYQENRKDVSINKPYHQIAGPKQTRPQDGKHETIKPKDLCGIPWRVALALQADGWYLRSDIVWHKPNPMPESCKDRPTKSHEYLFLMTKNPKYYYDTDAIREHHSPDNRKVTITTIGQGAHENHHGSAGHERWPNSGRNKRSVWTIPTQPFPQAHFATFPKKLIEPCILAGTSEKGCCVECGAPWERVVEKTVSGKHEVGGKLEQVKNTGFRNDGNKRMGEIESKTIGWQPTCKNKAVFLPLSGDVSQCDADIQPCTVLDPFFGSGTTGLVAYRHGRKFIGIDLSKTYLDEIAIPRIEQETQQLKMF